MEKSTEEWSTSLRSSWKFPAVVHFCRVFEGELCLRQFSSDKLEASLLNPGDHSVFLSELISRLLYPARKKNDQNRRTWPTWETNLCDKVKAQWSLTMDHDPFETTQHFVEVSPGDKLEILFLLTDIAVQSSSALRDAIKESVESTSLTADWVRNLPIGEDSLGNKYYMFSLRYEDCRLYKLKVSRDDRSPQMVTLTTTLEELKKFIDSLTLSKNMSEKKLYRYLFSLLPDFERTAHHRERVARKAAAREQLPLLKRSSKMLEKEERRKERAKGKKKKNADAEVKNDDMLIDEAQPSVTLGISRAERMRLRNQRRELAERGLTRVLTGKKRVLEYDGLTPLGASVQVARRKRLQSVRPSRNITKLVSIIWEKFRRPMIHRKQFEIHHENAKTRRAAWIQGRNHFMASQFKAPTRPLEGLPIRDPRLPTAEAAAPSVGTATVLLNYLQQQPGRSSYPYPGLQMPRPLQTTSDFLTHQSPLQQSIQYPEVKRELMMHYAPHQRASTFPEQLRRQVMVQQQRPLIPTNYMHRSPDMRAAANTMLQGYMHRMSDPTMLRGIRGFSRSDPNMSHLNGMHLYPNARHVAPHMIPTQLSRSLVHVPNSHLPVAKHNWDNCLTDGSEFGKMSLGQSYFFNHGMSRGLEGRRPSVTGFPFDNPGFQHGQMMSESASYPGQDPRRRPPLFMNRKQNN